MNTLIKIIGIAFIGTILYQVLKKTQTDVAPLTLLATGCLLLFILAEPLTEAVNVFRGLSEKSGLNNGLFSSILRIIGIGYLTEYSSSICEDGGCVSLSKKIELAGKTVILLTALPIFNGIGELLSSLL